ncbi:hypothetical protein OUZ56_026321 [Daphnia magna]|uniref:Uncharacterized protein n=1 Tax=Daphnia magna TaxID=35525 RepID=A0ABQ9ZLF2_9CRUS|nr:hypothetical protein OUZ56_026321 [Daphnia magna]
MPINLSWRGDEILARGKNGREKQKGKKGGTEFPTNIHFSMETYGERADVSKLYTYDFGAKLLFTKISKNSCLHIEVKTHEVKTHEITVQLTRMRTTVAYS